MEGRTSQLNKSVKIEEIYFSLKAKRKEPIEYERLEMLERKKVNVNAQRKKKGKESQMSLVSENMIYNFFFFFKNLKAIALLNFINLISSQESCSFRFNL